MQCDAFDRRLNDLLDRRASPASDPLVREHVARCDRCRTILRMQSQLDGVVQGLEMPVVEPIAVGSRMSLAAVSAAKDSGSRSRENSGASCVAPKSHETGNVLGPRCFPLPNRFRRCVVVMPALAALLFLGGVAGWLFHQTQIEISRAPGLIQSTMADERANSLGGPARPTDPVSGSIQTSVLALHQPLLGLKLLSKTNWSDTLSSVSPDIEVPPLKMTWMTDVANEMAPVQQSMASALNLLRRTLVSRSANEPSIND